MFVEDRNEEDIKNQILKNLCAKLTDKIRYDEAYRKFLLKSLPLHDRLLITIDDAISINEKEEKYELCSLLLNFKQTIRI